MRKSQLNVGSVGMGRTNTAGDLTVSCPLIAHSVPTPLYCPPSLTTATENDKGHRDGGGEASQPTSDVGSYSNSVGICRHRGMTGLHSYRVRFPGSLPFHHPPSLTTATEDDMGDVISSEATPGVR